MTLPPFLFDVTTTIPEFLSWKMGVFSEKITEGRVYLRARIPSLHPTTDDTNSRLVLTPHVEDEDVKDLKRGIGRLYDITSLYRLIFPDPVTHPLIHHSVCQWAKPVLSRDAVRLVASHATTAAHGITIEESAKGSPWISW